MARYKAQLQSKGPLFTSPDCNAAREYFRSKPKGMVNKVMSVSDAVAQFVSDGE